MHFPHKTASLLRRRIDAACVARFGFALSDRPFLKVPFAHKVNLPAVRSMLRHFLLHLGLAWQLVEWFIARAVVVPAKSATVKAMLCNHKRMNKECKHTSPPTCRCQGLPLPRAASGHVCTPATHPAATLHFGAIVGVNANSVLEPDTDAVIRTVQHGIMQFFNTFVRRVLSHDVCLVCVMTPDMAHYLATTVVRHDVDVHPSYTTEAAVSARKALRGLVVAPMDRNPGVLHIMCPAEMHARMSSMFWQDEHYDWQHISEAELLRRQRLSYHAHGFSTYVPWQPGVAANANIIPKAKDDSRMRPIIDTTQVPQRAMSKAVAAVLIHLLTAVWAAPSFNITATKHLAAKVAEFSQYFTRFQDVDIFAFDVKNMYTELRHAAIDSALYQFLQLVRSRLKSLKFHIHKFRKRKKACVGSNPGSKLFYSLPFHVLHKYVLWELDNNYFWAGNVLLKQRIGISMGGSCSPVLAQILCTWSEYVWLSSLGVDAKFIRGVRFMDDSMLFIAKGHTHLARAYTQHCFPAECVLEGDLEPTHCAHMLESTVFVYDRHRLGCVHRNKNFDSLFNSWSQKVLRYVHVSSAARFSTKHQAACGVCYRMVSNTTATHFMAMWAPLWAMFVEYRLLGYSFGFLLHVCKSILHRCHLLPVLSHHAPQLSLFWRTVCIALTAVRAFFA